MLSAVKASFEELGISQKPIKDILPIQRLRDLEIPA
jgi:hypothetical protein